MHKAPISATLIAVVLTAGLSPLSAAAREGAQSVGQGVKCYTAAVPQPNGTVQYQRICYKGV